MADDIRCYHCSTVYPAGADRCPHCGLIPGGVFTPDPGKQAACPHTNRTSTAAGGFTCDDCGSYLFDHSRPGTTIAIVRGAPCYFNEDLGQWVPLPEDKP